MPNNTLNIFDTYYMAGMVSEISPVPSFFRDRYFPTAADDVFAADKVLVEYRDGDNYIAPFVVRRVGDIPVARGGYEIHEFQPAYIAPSRLLTLDDLRKRGYGEAIFSGSTQEERAHALQMHDLSDLDRFIRRREEWMAAQTMLNNGCTIVSYIDNDTVGETDDIFFYDTSRGNPAQYTIDTLWDDALDHWSTIRSDVRAMCRMLTSRGLPARDLVLGSAVADFLMSLPDVQNLLNKNSGIEIGSIVEELSKYDGVTFMGILNFGGHRLNVISVDEQYKDKSGTSQNMFPADAVMVTAPGCGHMMYGQITQMEPDYEFHSFAMPRVPKLCVDRAHDMRSLRLASCPLAAPNNKAPWIIARGVISIG